MKKRWQIELVENVTDLAYRFLSFQIFVMPQEDEMAGALIAKLMKRGTYLHEFCLLSNLTMGNGQADGVPI